MRVLVVTAVAAEGDAVCGAVGPDEAEPSSLPGSYELRRGDAVCGADGSDEAEPSSLPGGDELRRVVGRVVALDVLVAGVGPAAAAAGTATALTAAALSGEPYSLAVSAGIGGGFPPGAPLGSVVVADAIVAADLGAETPDGFTPVTGLGFGRVAHHPDPALVKACAAACGGVTGTVLTVSTATGGAARAAELAARHPEVRAEAMEGFGVAEAAAAHGVPVLEIRTVSNAVGPRDRAAWRIGDALAALTDAFRTLPGALATAATTAPAPETPHP
ncbi:futalosine hydrolase [Streptomyces halobius]|uniref:Futalosine hydrolase n=1 Tax=Streptomyces halobius TaxID=2879846 RepID=A0ABY4MB09_9ACTN|nr:futalosine hydrolase [Streptomyces halobius]UQA93595.1 futalosine hydrolase [Streptomyces halobius]